MLNDPRYDYHNLEALIAWLETENPKKLVDFAHPGRCLMAEYLKGKGISDNIITGLRFSSEFPGFLDLLLPEGHQPRYYGEVLKEAKKALERKSDSSQFPF